MAGSVSHRATSFKVRRPIGGQIRSSGTSLGRVFAQHGITQAIEVEFDAFCYPDYYSGSRYRLGAFARQRINSIEIVLGADAVERAVSEAYEQYGAANPGEAWRIFLTGTPEEVSAFHREVELFMEQNARETVRPSMPTC